MLRGVFTPDKYCFLCTASRINVVLMHESHHIPSYAGEDAKFSHIPLLRLKSCLHSLEMVNFEQHANLRLAISILPNKAGLEVEKGK